MTRRLTLEREHYFIIVVVICSIIILLCLDALDDHISEEWESISWAIQDIGYICIGAMLALLLMLMVESLKDNIRLKELEKKLEELKKGI